MSKRTETLTLNKFIKQLNLTAEITIEPETRHGYFCVKTTLEDFLINKNHIYNNIKDKKIKQITWDGSLNSNGYGIIIEIEGEYKSFKEEVKLTQKDFFKSCPYTNTEKIKNEDICNNCKSPSEFDGEEDIHNHMYEWIVTSDGLGKIDQLPEGE
ncbi:hypothetical protein SSYRP_v1c04440 [Spiroplasma syrphidicola EA-1]|uniref:Uncharacterized protein n=1 Tax=Spiroplasma syrphidicola EA-1 TaxID=1276229 RepID=R4ULA2_9MOLU|nr:hypothetical protein [Spiroplasma syrphidicola]AGM26036.1 hypothetical protein SSYRP_v1c04440 [Spiroplasma syrphidicola EA-1]